MPLVFVSIIGVSLLFGCDTDRPIGAGPAQIATAEAAGKLHQCASCHGEDGISSAEIFPNLAGQHKEYITAQLTAFRNHTRQDRNAKTYMWGMARGLSDDTIKILAADYSAKSPAPAASGAKADVAAGAAIYTNGVAAHGVLACVSCHGARGAGNAVIPALAGQHKDYLVVQLGAFASGARDNATMHLIAKGMTPNEMKAVATYLSAL
jgi:cytochrome c553